MGKLFQVNGDLFYAHNPYVEKNEFINAPMEDNDLPLYEDIKDKLPLPVWEGHKNAIDCYDKTWQLAFGNLRKPVPDTGFVSNFIDTAFNGYLFMWDSSFILMFGKYGNRIFDFQRTLDNMYSHQHRDGFICREICETQRGEQFTKDDPASTGPNIMPWSEWDYYLMTGKKDRISKVFYPLLGYHKWLQLNRSWQDGSYWCCGLSCGMDNQERLKPGFEVELSHGFMSWIDACAQMYLSGSCLIEMAKLLGKEDEVKWIEEEHNFLSKTINETMWSDADHFYHDKYRDGSLSRTKSVAAFWTLVAGLVPKERLESFVAHLDNEKEFKRPNRVPSLSADDPNYNGETGGYWNGAVWSPTTYMVLKGLTRNGCDKLAHEIGMDHHRNVVKVFEEFGTVYENYSPEKAMMGSKHADFVGWTGLSPISILFEYVFGIRPDALSNRIVWDIRLTEKHGIKRYPFRDATLELICEARKSEDEEPVLTVKSDKPVTVEVRYGGKTKIIEA